MGALGIYNGHANETRSGKQKQAATTISQQYNATIAEDEIQLLPTTTNDDTQNAKI